MQRPTCEKSRVRTTGCAARRTAAGTTFIADTPQIAGTAKAAIIARVACERVKRACASGCRSVHAHS
jgi:hypothetical protein